MVSSVFDEVSLTRENAVVKAAEWVFTNSVTSMHPDLKAGFVARAAGGDGAFRRLGGLVAWWLGGWAVEWLGLCVVVRLGHVASGGDGYGYGEPRSW